MKFMCDNYVWTGVIEYWTIKHFAVSFYFALVQRSGTDDEAKKDEFTKKMEEEMRNTDSILGPLRQFRSNIIEEVDLMMQSICDGGPYIGVGTGS
eukprot:ANDGO_01108.mRNA.1 hypothetical protein